jgi:antitoxin (DNA-binding transcriptional repressor) of toxin-antitoxin stability system
MSIQVMKSDEARTRWRDLLDTASAGETDTVIERHGKPTATVVNYEQYLQAKAILDEIRAIKDADKMVQKWLKNPKIGRPYSEIRKRLVEEGILDE